jgi:hypothetical protein
MSNRGGFCKVYDRRDEGKSGPVILPPFDTIGNVLAFDPDGVGNAQFITGPIGTITGATKDTTGPNFYNFVGADEINFGNSLDAVWTSGTFTLYGCIWLQMADMASSHPASILSKSDGGINREFEFYGSGAVNILNFCALDTYFAGLAANQDTAASAVANAASAGKRVYTVSWTQAAARGSRIKIYINGVLDTTPQVFTLGIDGTILAGVAPLRIGGSAATGFSLSRIGPVYAYNNVHSDATVTNIASWLRSIKGWK